MKTHVELPTPFGNVLMRHSTLLYAAAPAVCLAIGIGAYELDKVTGEIYEHMRLDGVETVPGYSVLSEIFTDRQIEATTELAAIITTFSIISFPAFVLWGQLGRAGRKRMGENLELNCPNF